jgi:hypothetical protein
VTVFATSGSVTRLRGGCPVIDRRTFNYAAKQEQRRLRREDRLWWTAAIVGVLFNLALLLTFVVVAAHFIRKWW